VRDRSVPLEWFETEILTRNGESMRTVMTDPEHPSKRFRYPYDIAQKAGLVLGFSDDFYADRANDKKTVGIIIREGQILYSKTNKNTSHYLPNLDMMAHYPDGRLEVYECNELTAQELIERGAVNVFSFGPILIRDGEINEMLYSYYRSNEPRQVLGMIEPNHYFLLSILGRIQSSKGTLLQMAAEMMKNKGVTQALNLDGGNTLALVFNGKILNKKATYRNKTFYRTLTSMIGFGHTDYTGE
jgi:exopolysaccharide biosynthesis protein